MDHVKGLLEIIVRHDQIGRFGVHLIHRHDRIANDSVRVESRIGLVPGKWNKAATIDSLDLTNIHGVVFKFVPDRNRFVPFEFCQGASPISARDVDNQFVQDFASYLTKNHLVDTFSLEFVDPADKGQPEECMAEIEVDNLGTVVLPRSAVNAKEFLPTGWPSAAVPPLPLNDSEPPPGQTWAKGVDESHKVFINKTIEGAADLVDELRHQGVLKF